MPARRIAPIVPVADLADAVGFPAGMGDRRRQVSAPVEVDGDIVALYARLAPALDRLPPGRVRAPFDQPFGQREFHVIDEAHPLFSGTPVAEAGR